MNEPAQFIIDLEESFPHLDAAPIVEAVIQWRARAQKPLDPGEFKNQLVERLPDYPTCQAQQELHLEAQFTAESAAAKIRRDNWRGFRLTSSNKLYVAQFSRDGLVYSRLHPYENWDSFVAEGVKLWTIFIELSAPSEIQRLDVRFINRIMPVPIDHVGRYLTQPPKCLEPMGLPASGFMYQSTHDVPGYPFKINVVRTVQPSAPPQAEGFGLIVDINVFTTQALQCEYEILQQYLKKLRWLKNKAFFSLLKPSAIKKFKRPSK